MKQSIVEVPTSPMPFDVQDIFDQLMAIKPKALRLELEPGDTRNALGMMLIQLIRLGLSKGISIQYLQDGGNSGNKNGIERIRMYCQKMAVWVSDQAITSPAREGRRSEVRR